MTDVFLYAKPEKPKVFVGGREVQGRTVNSKWIVVGVEEREFQVETLGIRKSFNVGFQMKYAVFKQELVEIVNSPKRILMVTDLDSTLHGLTEEACLAKERFLRFWIRHFEFNGSKLVYNTGRSVEEYVRDKDLFYEPDLAVLLLGNFACKFLENGEITLLESFPQFLKTFKDQDWDVKVYFEEIISRFSFLRPYFVEYFDNYMLFRLPRELMIENQLEIKNYVKNKEKRVVNGRCFQAKMIVTSQDDSENLLLEIIPKYSGKGTAVKYAQMLFGFIDEETFTAGDSLNDRDAFKVESVRGVIVQNAQETLIKWFKNKKRENIFLSNENFGLALIDILSKFALEETSSTIFIYRENENLKVTVDEKVCVLKSFREKWAYFSTQSRNFTVNDGITFEIPENGRFALYRSKLLRIQMNLFDVLFVSDLDGTIFMNTPEGLQFYYDFIEFWITFYEFNSSVLVYNTGRNIPNYLEEAENLFQPDLLLTSLSSFAFQLDKKLTMSDDKNFFQFLMNVPRHDWNSEALVKILQEKFKFKQENFERIYETYILARVKSKMIRSQLANIKNFLKNKENLQHAGYVFKGKVRVLKLGMVGKRLVEIIPLFVGKGFGVRYAQMKFSFEPRFTVVAGDSPNDIDAFKTDANCIAMINSEEMLKDWVNKKKRDNLVVSQQKWAKGLEIEFRKRLIN